MDEEARQKREAEEKKMEPQRPLKRSANWAGQSGSERKQKYSKFEVTKRFGDFYSTASYKGESLREQILFDVEDLVVPDPMYPKGIMIVDGAGRMSTREVLKLIFQQQEDEPLFRDFKPQQLRKLPKGGFVVQFDPKEERAGMIWESFFLFFIVG